MRLFEKLLDHLRAHKLLQLLRARGKHRTDSTHVLAAVHAVDRLNCVGQTLKHAPLNPTKRLKGQSLP